MLKIRRKKQLPLELLKEAKKTLELGQGYVPSNLRGLRTPDTR